MPNRSKEELVREISLLQDHLAESEATAARVHETNHRLSLLEATMETVPVGVVLADAKGRIIHGNTHVENMLRHPVLYSDGVNGYGEWISFHEDGRRVESNEYPLSRIIRDGEERSEIDVHYQRGDGSRFWLRIIGKPVHNAGGERIGATVALIDIDRERQLQSEQKILIGELNHRVMNAFSVVKSIVNQSLRVDKVYGGVRESLDARLDAYAKAHSKLVGTAWDRAFLKDVAKDVLAEIASNRVRFSGPEVEFPSKLALAFSMTLYELATNAVKYGALSTAGGSVDLVWSEVDGTLEVIWRETGGPEVAEPDRTGFGSLITGRALELETDGQVTREFRPEGLVWTFVMPWPLVLNGSA